MSRILLEDLYEENAEVIINIWVWFCWITYWNHKKLDVEKGMTWRSDSNSIAIIQYSCMKGGKALIKIGF